MIHRNDPLHLAIPQHRLKSRQVLVHHAIHFCLDVPELRFQHGLNFELLCRRRRITTGHASTQINQLLGYLHYDARRQVLDRFAASAPAFALGPKLTSHDVTRKL